MRTALQLLLDELLWDIYGKVSLRQKEEDTAKRRCIYSWDAVEHICPHSWKYPFDVLQGQSIESLTQICASLRLEIRIIGSYLTRVLIKRDRKQRRQEMLCDVVTACLQALSDKSADAKDMRFRLLPPSPPKLESGKTVDATSSDFNQWLHAMKMVARLPGGMPPEFRKKLWLSLADRYLETKKVDWEKEQTKCFSEQWREDDEELGIQIVKDLHRTGSSLCSGPAGSLNQAKLKRILLGYARWNPEVGYCQGFNMLGALILQVMDKNEEESMKVMIFLVEGVLPPGYFSGSMRGLQADMAVFRELMTSKLPRLAKHLQRLQGPVGEGSFEPPLTNVFTMQWFLTLFCTCLPINCVFRVWDLILIEGSDVLLRTALGIWSLLENKILTTKTADDFYCRMGTLSGELLNGHLIDSNGLIEKVVELGPIADLQKLREKHLYNIAPWQDRKGLKIFYSDDEADSDEDSRLAVATVWGLRLNRRGSSTSASNKPTPDNKDRIALDISLLKKQYDRLRERQRQAHIILTSAVAKQGNPGSTNPNPPLQVNQLLMGRSAIVTHKGRRIGPPQGAIPPARKTLPITTSKSMKQSSSKPVKRGETLHWHDTEASKRRKGSITLKESAPSKRDSQESDVSASSRSNIPEKVPMRVRKKSESSSYSEDSDANSSTSTSLCDDEDLEVVPSSVEASPLRKFDLSSRAPRTDEDKVASENEVPEIVLMNFDMEENSLCNVPGREKSRSAENVTKFSEMMDEDSSAECDRIGSSKMTGADEKDGFVEDAHHITSPNASANITPSCASSSLHLTSSLDKPISYLDVAAKSPLEITSTSQLSPIADISSYISNSSISPLRTPSTPFDLSNLLSSRKSEESAYQGSDDSYDASEEGVTNEYFERVNLVERPKKLDLLFSLNDNESFLKKFRLSPVEDVRETTTSDPTPQKIDQDEKNSDAVEVNQSFERNSFHQSSDVPSTDHYKIESSGVESAKSSNASSSTKHVVRHPIPYHINREKSFSFDDATLVEKEEPRPTSCPEARADISEGKARSDRVLKIIEENSMILHRILKEHAISPKTDYIDDTDLKLASPRESVSLAWSREKKQEFGLAHQKDEVTSVDRDKELDNSDPVQECILSAADKPDNKKSPDKLSKSTFATNFESTGSFRKIDRDRSTSRPRSRTEIPSRFDDNIADRLISIKKTIKSIDSLCEERPYRREKCQRYIDSLFEKKPVAAPLIHVSEPANDFNSNKDYTSTETSSYSGSSRYRYSRDSKRDVSPRRRQDEEKEEYESRVRRDYLPTYSSSYKENDEASIERSLKNNNKSPVRWNNQIRDNDKDTFSLSSSSSYVPNKIEIRHTTVTSTMYDRYLYQKKERDARYDKSPPSPVITKAYLDSLKPNPSYSSNRYARSAENSPSREKTTSIEESTSPTAANPATTPKGYQIRSCDNILAQLRTCSALTVTTTTQPYSSLSSPKSYQKSFITVEPYKGPLDRSNTKT